MQLFSNKVRVADQDHPRSYATSY